MADLVLTDAPLNISPVHGRKKYSDDLRKPSLELPGYPRETPNLPSCKTFDPSNALIRAFGNFTNRAVAKLMSQWRGLSFIEPIFLSLLVVSEAQTTIQQLERDIRRLQSRATHLLERLALDAMGELRRTLADLRELMSDTKMRMMRWEIGGYGVIFNVSDSKTATESGDAKKDATHVDLVVLLDSTARLEEKLEVMTKTVNEEIQLFIASISIRDSEVMMADSRIMKQQAARTTLLTTLAIIYLPLQLITGIFGMNIKEITGDGGPRWWDCLIALGVGGVSTFLVYLSVKWWQWRGSMRKKRDGKKEKEV
jgi:hypothetical protein